MSYSINEVTYNYPQAVDIDNLIPGTYTVTGYDSSLGWDSKLIITDELSGTTTSLIVIGSSTAVEIKVTGTCSACTAGQYQNENALVLAPCKACPDGTYQLDTPNTCQFCPVGFASITPDTACTACAAGQYQNQNNAPAAACLTCSAGKFSPDAETACGACEPGKYQLAAATEYQCKFCAAGSAFTSKSTACTACTAGQYQNQNDALAVTCSTCSAGKFSPAASAECKFCVAGYAFTSESTACTACTAGQYQNQNNALAVTCSTCSAGKFSPAKETACVACDEGKYQLGSATEYQCKFCDKGTEFASKSTACTACAADQYQDENALGSATCKSCPIGYVFTSNSTACESSQCINRLGSELNTASCMCKDSLCTAIQYCYLDVSRSSSDIHGICTTTPPCAGSSAITAAADPFFSPPYLLPNKEKCRCGVQHQSYAVGNNNQGQHAEICEVGTYCRIHHWSYEYDLDGLGIEIAEGHDVHCEEHPQCVTNEVTDHRCKCAEPLCSAGQICTILYGDGAVAGWEHGTCSDSPKCDAGQFLTGILKSKWIIAGEYPSEMSYEINGVTYDYSDGDTETVNIAVGTYNLTGHDSYGDGWNGGTLEITDANGAVINTFTVAVNWQASVEIKVNASMLACTDCATGKYQNQNDATAVTCSTCSAGMFAPDAGTACNDCGEGKYQELESATEYQCKFCNEGTEFTTKNTTCTTCGAGQYQDENALVSATCKACPDVGTAGTPCGCLDPTATNYNPVFYGDDGSCTYKMCVDCVLVMFVGTNFVSDNRLTVTNCDGDQLLDENQFTSSTEPSKIGLVPYTNKTIFTLSDIYGDGWGGNKLLISNPMDFIPIDSPRFSTDGLGLIFTDITVSTGSLRLYSHENGIWSDVNCTDPCRTIPCCTYTDGGTENDYDCQCGTAVTDSNKKFCDASHNQVSAVASCQNIDGETQNADTCQCGTAVTDSNSNKKFCKKSHNFVSNSTIVVCIIDNGSAQNAASCTCGNTVCTEESGLICYAGGGGSCRAEGLGAFGYIQLRKDTCASVNGLYAISDQTICQAAAASGGLSDTTAEDDGQSGVDLDPFGCYFEGNSLKYNNNGNTGTCSVYDTCLCIAAAACDEGLNTDACMCQTALCTTDTGLNCADGTCIATTCDDTGSGEYACPSTKIYDSGNAHLAPSDDNCCRFLNMQELKESINIEQVIAATQVFVDAASEADARTATKEMLELQLGQATNKKTILRDARNNSFAPLYIVDNDKLFLVNKGTIKIPKSERSKKKFLALESAETATIMFGNSLLEITLDGATATATFYHSHRRRLQDLDPCVSTTATYYSTSELIEIGDFIIKSNCEATIQDTSDFEFSTTQCDTGTFASVEDYQLTNTTCQYCGPGYGLGLTGCELCDGEFNKNTDTSACNEWSTCNAGQKQNVAPTSTVNRGCTACDAGMYQAENGFTGIACTIWSLCAAGEKQDGAPSLSVNRGCTDCDSGRYQDESEHFDTQCKFCAAGFAFASKSACTACANGKYQDQDNVASASCKFCVAGKKFDTKATACTDCDAGKYQYENTAASASCKFCVAGRRFNTKATDCVDCSGGKYQTQDDAPSVTCLTCGAGQYAVSAAAACGDCETGKYKVAATEYQCKFCDKGTEFDTKSTACAACTGGQYQDQDTVASATCKTCNVGQYASSKETPCGECETGKFQELAAATKYQCKFCASGKEFTSKSTACTACATGEYQDQDDAASASCKFCAAGKTSDGTVCTDCDGYNLDPTEDCKPMSELPVDYQNHQCCQNCASGTEADCAFTDGSVHDKCGCIAYQAISVTPTI